MLARDGAVGWAFSTHVLFHRTGFPFEWTEALRSPRALAAWERRRSAWNAADACRSRLLGGDFGEALASLASAPDRNPARRALSRARSRVGRREPVADALLEQLRAHPIGARLLEWNAALARLAEADSDFRRCYRDDLQAGRACLAESAGREVFRQAVFNSNPGLYPRPLNEFAECDPAALRTGPVRRRERLAASYLQRGAAKCDVASLFGPVNYARIRPELQQAIMLDQDRSRLVGRHEVFVSFWPVEELAKAIARDREIRPYLRPRFVPVCEIEGGSELFVHFSGRRLPLEREDAKLLEALDGLRSVLDLAALLDRPAATIGRALERFAGRGVVDLTPPVPSDLFHPLEFLIETVEAIVPKCARAKEWALQLRELEALRRAYSAAGLEARADLFRKMEERFETLTGAAPRRCAGEFYADRTILHEDCRGAIRRLDLGAPFLDKLVRTAAALDLCAAYGTLFRRHYQWMARQAYDSLAAGSDRDVPFSALVSALQAMGRAGRFPRKSNAMVAFEGRWADLVREAAAPDGVVELERPDLEELIALGSPIDPVHAELDVLIAARSEDAFRRQKFSIVIGEIGENVPIWGSQFYFYDEAAEAEQEAREIFGELYGPQEMAIILPRRPHKGLLNRAFPGVIVDALAQTTRSARESIRVSELRVGPAGEELSLKAPDGRLLRFFHHHDELAHLWAFASPRMMIPPLESERLPRIVIDGVVLQRRRWHMPAPQARALAGDGPEGFRRAPSCAANSAGRGTSTCTARASGSFS
jgi:hypothetical protein